jgi:type II secretory pathway pseudopilin PulG
MAGRPSQGVQMLGSLLVALVIVAIAIAVVTAQFGPTNSAELDAREERLQQREEIIEERQELEEERRERDR